MKLDHGQLAGYILYQGACDRKEKAPVYVSKTILCNLGQAAVWVFVVGVAHHPTDAKKTDMVVTYHEDTNKYRCVEWDLLCQWSLIDANDRIFRSYLLSC
jgi:hypothetical protein